MGIGAGIVLVAIGAILTFAVNASLNGVNIHTVGVILMIVGAIGVLIDLAIFMPRRRSVVTRQVDGYPAAGSRTVVEDRSTY